ncbi:hypothetical protein [Demequina sp. NBRC 110053]|uniref:hypothetical protein n=1 Tax=Demequina sp. NBRC 110053 TaxID=1570342 RepID=UPI000A05C2D7|nr:hypothetical protein [Demequina sp. NBRC 110053]
MRIVLEPDEIATALRSQVREVTAARVTGDGELEVDVALAVGPVRASGTGTVREVTVDGGRLRAVADVRAGRFRAPGFALRMGLARLWKPERSSLPPGTVDIDVRGSAMHIDLDVRALADLLAPIIGLRIVVERVEIGPAVTVIGTLVAA